MARQIIKCPDGGYNMFSTISDSWMFERSCRKESIIKWLTEEAAFHAQEDAETIFRQLESGENPYYQFAYSFAEADEMNSKTLKDRGEK